MGPILVSGLYPEMEVGPLDRASAAFSHFCGGSTTGYHCGTMVQSMGSKPEKVPDPEVWKVNVRSS